MKNKPSIRFLILVGIAALLVASAALPLPARSVAAKADLYRLTIENRSSGPLYVWLEGPAFYYLSMGSEKTGVFTVAPGEYSYRFRACGDTVSGELEITTHRKLVMPVCGGRAGPATGGSQAVGAFDIGSEIKIVKVAFENVSDSRLFVIMTGPTTYVFTFEEDAEKDYTIAKGDYTVQVWGCGRYGTRNFSAFKGKTFELDCPKP